MEYSEYDTANDIGHASGHAGEHVSEGFHPSVQQQRLWQDQAGGAAVLVAARLTGHVDAPRLREALAAAAARHEVLRTRLHAVAGMHMPIQVIEDDVAIDWLDEEGDEEGNHEGNNEGNNEGAGACAGEEARWARLQAHVAQAARPVLAAALLRPAAGPCRLLLAARASCADGASLRRLLREAEAAYRGAALDEPQVQYADFGQWQHDFLEGGDSAAGRAFWERQVDPSLARMRHPLARRTPASAPAAYLPARQARAFDGRWSDLLLTAAAGLGTSPATILSVCWSVLLQRQLGLSAVMLGWRHDGRSEATAAAIGPYAKTLALLAAHGEDLPLAALVRAQDGLLAEAQSCHESAPGTVPPYGFAPCKLDERGAWHVDAMDEVFAPHALCLEAQERRGENSGEAGGVHLALRYDAARFDSAAAALLLDQLATLTEQACRQAELPLGQCSGFSDVQAQGLAALQCAAAAPRGPAVLQALFEAQAAKRADAVAVVQADRQLSYGELNARANRLAHRLRRAGVAPETPVGLYAGRSIDAVVGMLAILKAGGAYLPLDPGYPAERLDFMLADSGAPLVLTVAEHAARLAAYATLVLDEPEQGAGDGQGDTHDPATLNAPDSLAYIIYTSGSTGTPKGVMVSHRNAVHSTMARWHDYDVECESFLLSSSFSFDSSVAGLFWTLSQGGRLCLPTDAQVQDAAAMGQLIERHRASHVLMLASFYSQVLEAGPPARLASLRCVIVAGEAAPASVAARHRTMCPQARLYNEYGPTEASVWCTLYQTAGNDDEGGVLPIGRAIADMKVHVLDKQLAQLPQGVAGEIHVGGSGITRGYLKRPGLTAERFVPDPFGPPGARLYRTGDIGRVDAAGCIEFLGRVDHQVKIRGFRVELGEVEARLLQIDAVREAAVVARADRHGELRLVAYVAARAACPAIALLRGHLEQHLPAHMVPAEFVVLDALPLTPNGKLDRAALPEPGGGQRPAYRAPRGETERLLAQVWEEVLDAPRIGLDDHFFELGGHSLVATRLVSRVRSLLRREVAVRSVFQYPRLGEFARHALAGSRDQGLPLEKGAPGEPAPLSYPQQRLWQFQRNHPGSVVYNVPSAVRLHGALDGHALQRAFDELVRRHEALRTTFACDAAGVPMQVIHPAAPVCLAHADAPSEDELVGLLVAEENTPFDLAAGPLLRAGVIRQGEHAHVLWLTLHHIVSDRWSMQVLVRELGALYAAFSAGQPAPLAEPVLQYADFARWQQRQVAAGLLQDQLDYWKGQLRADQPALQLPGMQARPARQSHRGATYRCDIGRDLAGRIGQLGRAHGATPFMTTLALFKALLAQRSSLADVPVGIVLANRNRLELEGLTGCLINMLALRADLAENDSVGAYIGQVRDAVLAAQANQDVPFECVVQAVQPQETPGATPLFQVLFDLHQERIVQSEGMGELAFADAPAPDSPTTHFDLMVGIGEREDGLRLSLVYCTDLFDEPLIAELAGAYVALLERATTSPEAPLRPLQL